MRTRIVGVLLAAVGLVLGAAAPSQAAVSTGNVVTNMGRDYDVAIQAGGVWFNYVGSGQSVSNATCLKPRVYMVSQWGGGYAAGVTRCFSTANNKLKLYRFGEGPA